VSGDYHFEDEVTQRAYDARLMRRLVQYIRPYTGLFVVATIMLLLASVFNNVIPLLNKYAIDDYINDSERVAIEQEIASIAEAGGTPTDAQVAALDATRESNAEGIYKMILIISLVLMSNAVVSLINRLVVIYVGQRTMLKMRMDIFSHLQQMSLKFLDRNPVGRLMTRVTTDVEKIQQTVVDGLVAVIGDLLTIVVVLVFMVRENGQLTVVSLVTVPFLFASSFVFRKFARRSYLGIRKRVAALSAYSQENITGMRVVQLFAREQLNFNEYKKRNAAHRDEWFGQIRNYAIYLPLIEFLTGFTVALIVFFGGRQILGGTGTIGDYFAFVMWTERLFGPIRALADRYNMLQEAMASSERIFQLLDTEPDVVDKPDAVPCKKLEGHVDFEDMFFAYDGDQWVLKDINLSIAPGERVAIVGHTGAGKSSLINLLSRFYDVQQGTVKVDGVDVRDYGQESLRRNIGVVLQDVFLFSGTIEDNIRLGDDSMTDEHIRACAAYVNAAPFIEKMPGGYAYDVGERGCNLSTGQRQLLSFARALAHSPHILVLDEATSSVDTETEQLIQDAIVKLMEGHTSIVIAHRLSTVQHADRIVVMHHGEIREVGTHQELLQQRGLYHRLYQLQYKDQNSTA
jgi:ABC-type multidrug transport system fused ATPase/permease subunit